MKIPTCKFVLVWAFSWALGLTALVPIVNYLTPLLNPAYNNAYTPDVYWRLVLYWHGMIFMPLIISLSALGCSIFGLYKEEMGFPGRLIKESILIGGPIAIVLAGIGGLFDIYDRFIFGIPLWTQITAFLIGDEIAIALIVAFIAKAFKARLSSLKIIYLFMAYAVFLTLISAILGHIAGWITWFGPWPSFVASYINQTMYPVLGFYNVTTVITWTENVTSSHSHLMLPVIMAGIVVLVAYVYGLLGTSISRRVKYLTYAGIAIMAGAMLAATVIYIISGVGNYSIPTLFSSGPNDINGLAMDDVITGTIGWGALLILVAFIGYAKANRRLNDPFIISLITAAILIYLTIPVTGYWIEFHETFYGAAGALPSAPGAAFDAAYTRFHQDFGFFLLPALITAIVTFEVFRISGRDRVLIGYLFTTGEIISFIAGELYSMVFISQSLLILAGFGLALMAVGGIMGIRYIIKYGTACPEIPWS
ncbi:hypothetical protein VMUT_1609 [Vulcanisaeta moutnovskia 768-28]|uniref:Uncharacterized protein n=1 Tax=Vulcanisaeta moutnovskia (strain 768-28) TaxID=985053 RepID=F0QU27_VULM7|nr:hypothetical protein [Vulcanisaeta moutnovskia]ADY01813.1 hypothetical protein VMUT_1609 [Vulcanisaeta moutnovskia 768-28]